MEVKENLFLKSLKVFLLEFLLCAITFLLGILAALRANEVLKEKQVQVEKISLRDFLLSFFLVTLILFLLIRFFKSKKGKPLIFKFLFTFSFFFGGVLLLNSFFPLIPSLILVFLLILWWLKFPTVLNQNVLMILGMAGIGVALGLKVDPEVMILILILLSIYDFIAVYKTKHMVKMAWAMIEMKIISALVIPQTISGFKNSLEKVRPGGEFFILGGGDVVLPLIFSISLIERGLLKSVLVAIFSLLGLFINFYFFLKQKERKPMPALPLISLFSIFGYLITLLLR